VILNTIEKREQMSVVVVGHVDHGKSTVIGRLMADTGSLPKGKLEEIRRMCQNTGRPFEYAFLLDALKDERRQGTTIDTARCFFKTALRDYIIIDAPGHMEFLKNMVTGAARAEAAILVIDAYEGVQENSRRHGYLVSMLGIKQVVVLVNKMDLVDYGKEVYENTVREYSEFLDRIDIKPSGFVPVSAQNGDNIVTTSLKTPWYRDKTVLEYIDSFRKETDNEDKPFRFPVQDIYKFTEDGDDRRIIAGTVEAGKIAVGDKVKFLPSGKTSSIKSIEEFNSEKRHTVTSGFATGFTLEDEIYVKPGEIMSKVGEPYPKVSTRFRSNIFWMGRAPLVKNKDYKLKLDCSRSVARLVEILNVIDASELSSVKNKGQIDRHDVADCIFETTKPFAFDLSGDYDSTSRFVIVDDYEIAGGGTVTENILSDESILKDHITKREISWGKGLVSSLDREIRYHHKSKFIVFTGDDSKRSIAKKLEKRLFDSKYNAYYLSIDSFRSGLDSDSVVSTEHREQQIRRLGELARILTDSGQIFITTLSDIDDYDIETLKILNSPHEIIVVNIGSNGFALFEVDVNIDAGEDEESAVEVVYNLLKKEHIIPDYVERVRNFV